MNKRRFFRALVCFLLICSILVTCVKPMTVDALAVESAVALGIVAFFILASAGVVYTVHSQQDLIGLGNSMQSSLYSWADTEDKLDAADTFIGYCKSYWSDDNPDRPPFLIPKLVVLALALWLTSLIKGDEEVEVEGEAAPEGYAYYNGVLLPVIPIFRDPSWSEYEYAAIVQLNMDSSYQCYVLGDSASLKFNRIKFGSSYYFGASGSSMRYRQYELTDGVWVFRKSGTNFSYIQFGKYNASKMDHYYGSLIWGSVDAYDENDALLLPASEPVYATTEIVTPSAYVGEIPEQVQSGEMEPEQIPLLSSLALGGIISSSANAVSDVSAVSEGLATGTLTYDAFLEQITPEADTEGDTGEGDTDPWDSPSDPEEFALDLKKFFPFCIPFDLYAFFTCLNADPVTPVIEWQVVLPGGSTYPLTIDLSPFNSLAQLLRRLELLVFCVGLAIKTRDLIRG